MINDNSYVSDALVKWYSANKRILPWRDTKDAYSIWISEIILQQTRVAQGYDYYVRFLEEFPNVESLADAEEDEILKLWQGLGYYSRARNLHTAAKTIVDVHNGEFPSTYDEILKLKGVGEYTAAAVGSFAFGLPHAVVDGNVFRVLSRLFAIGTPIDSTEGKKLFRNLANDLLNKEEPGAHNQAIMEFGALQCVPVSPNCEICPLADNCLALAEKAVAKYPVKQGKTKVKERFFYYFDIRHESSIYINKREGNDIWRSLYELPLIETDRKMSFEDLKKTDLFRDLFEKSGEVNFYSTELNFKHVLSHRVIFATFYRVDIADDSVLKDMYLKIQSSDLSKYAISRLVDKYFESSSKPDFFL